MAARPLYDDPPRAPRPSLQRAPRRRSRPQARARLSWRLGAVLVCVALLGIGRVALSFAVVQKSLQTDAVVRAQGQLASENQSLSEEVARLSSSIRIHNVALNRLGLVAATNVQYLTVHGVAAASR
jgi:cell division protein FtsB